MVAWCASSTAKGSVDCAEIMRVLAGPPAEPRHGGTQATCVAPHVAEWQRSRTPPVEIYGSLKVISLPEGRGYKLEAGLDEQTGIVLASKKILVSRRTFLVVNDSSHSSQPQSCHENPGFVCRSVRE